MISLLTFRLHRPDFAAMRCQVSARSDRRRRAGRHRPQDGQRRQRLRPIRRTAGENQLEEKPTTTAPIRNEQGKARERENACSLYGIFLLKE